MFQHHCIRYENFSVVVECDEHQVFPFALTIVFGFITNYNRGMGNKLIESGGKKGSATDIASVRREVVIMDILRDAIRGDAGHPHGMSIVKACEKNGLPERTWYSWVDKGYVSAPMQRLTSEVAMMAHEIVLPQMKSAVEALVSIATGEAVGDREKPPSYKDMLAAFDRLVKIVPIEAMGQLHGQSEQEFLETYQPQSVPINVFKDNNFSFMYKGGSGGAPVFGKMDGEVIDVDDVEPLSTSEPDT